MSCFSCGATLEKNSIQKMSFRAVCENCGASLHSCLGCKFHQVGLSNECRIPGTERIVDRSAANFCDEFSPTDKVFSKKTLETGKRFEDLFKS